MGPLVMLKKGTALALGTSAPPATRPSCAMMARAHTTAVASADAPGAAVRMASVVATQPASGASPAAAPSPLRLRVLCVSHPRALVARRV